jgi:hypothetical protein
MARWCYTAPSIRGFSATKGVVSFPKSVSGSSGVPAVKFSVKGDNHGLDQPGFRRSSSLLRNQFLRERKTLNLQDAHSDPRFCGRGWVSAVELRLRELCWGS